MVATRALIFRPTRRSRPALPPGIRSRLFEPPFTNINAQGPTAVFPMAQVMHIKKVLEEIQARPVA